MKIFNYISIILCCILAVSCEIDNYDGPDATIQGSIYDHQNQPFQVNQGAGLIRMREVSWAKDETSYVGNQTLKLQQDGTYTHTKWFSGEYRMLPYSGAFFPYDDALLDADDAGELVKISGTTTKDFTVTPYLTIEWVRTPSVTADNFIECTVRFKRNQKAGYAMPDLREGSILVSRTVNPSGGNDSELFPTPMVLTNVMEGTEITFRTSRAVKYTGIDYWIRIQMNCKTAADNADTNYPGMGANNFTTIEKIHVP
jgi:hypothetical protein